MPSRTHLRRALVVALLAAATVAGGGCGEEADSRNERLAESIQNEFDDELTAGQARSVLDAGCDPRGTRYLCTVDIGTPPDAVVEELSVRLGSDGCWVAHRTGLGRAGGRELEDEELIPRVVRGCLDGGG